MTPITIANAQADFERDLAVIGKMSTFLEFQSGGGNIFRTDVASRSGIAAAWAAPLQLEAADTVAVAAKVRRRLGRDKLIGKGSIRLLDIITRSRGLQTVQLLDTEGHPAGQVQNSRLHIVDV